MQRIQWNTMSTHLTTLSLPSPVLVVRTPGVSYHGLVIPSTSSSYTFFCQCIFLNLLYFTALPTVVTVILRSTYISTKLIILCLYHNIKLTSLSGQFERIYIVDLHRVAKLLQRDTLVLEKVWKEEISFKMLTLKHDAVREQL